MKSLLIAACSLTCAVGALYAQQGATEVPVAAGMRSITGHSAIAFRFAPRIANTWPWSIDVREDGSGTYREQGDVPAQAAIHISQPMLQKLEAGSAAVEANTCETKLKNIAQTGMKTISYARDAVQASCTFNYSDDAALNDTANAFLAIATTMQYGARLKHEHRFDHLGLSAEMDSLVEAVKGGRAIELANIAAVLQSLVDDEEVIASVRRRAQALIVAGGR